MTSAVLAALALAAVQGPPSERGHALLAKGRPQEAEQVLAAAVAVGPDDARALQALIQARLRLRKFPEAIRDAERLVSLRPRDPEARGQLARLNAWVGDHEKAVVLYREALALDRHNPGLKSDLADVLLWSHRYDEAERLYQEVLAVRPDHHEALKGLVRARLQAGNADGALQAVDLALPLYPRDADLLRDRASALAARGSLPEAARSLERAAAVAPADAGIQRQLGEIRFRQRDHERAVEAWRRASSLDPDGAGDHVLMARAYLAMGKTALAEQQLEVARRVSPLDPDAERLAADIDRERGVAPARTAGEWVELAAYLALLGLVLAVVRREKRVLRRRPALSWFARWVVPAFVLLNLAFHAFKGEVGRYLDARLAESGMEVVLFLGLGVAFVAVLRAERGHRDLGDEVVLAVGAHPDDVELGTAGFLLKLKASGARVYSLTVTRGEQGSPGSERRAEELGKAAEFLGLDGHWVLEFPDTGLGDRVPAVRAAIEEKIRQIGATLVLTHTEVDVHGDHRAVSAATAEAARRVPTVLAYEDVSTDKSFVPNYYVDVTDYIEDHLRAISFHRSQADKSYMDPEVLRGRAAHRGMQAGVSYALAFRTMNLIR